MSHPLLLIDKERSYAKALAAFIERLSFDVHIAITHDDIMVVMDQVAPEFIVASTEASDDEIFKLLSGIKNAMPIVQIVILVNENDKDEAMDRLRTDACAYLIRPIHSMEMELTLERARETVSLQKKLNRYTDKLGDLHQAITLYQQLFDVVPCYISVQNRQFRITGSNRLFKRHFGDGVGEYCYEVYKHRNVPCTVCPVAETFEDGQAHSTEEIVTSRDGEQYHVITWTAPIRDERGNITQVMEMSTNITLLRQLQSHLEFLGMMLGSMSHGVKGMLTALDGGIYQLETGLRRNDEQRTHEAFELVKQMAERIKKMVLDILYYAKSRELEYQAGDIETFVLTLCDTIKPSAEKRQVQFIHQMKTSGMFDADHNWFRSAIVNILENAIDACTEDKTKPDHLVELHVCEQDNMLVFKIRDNGVGIDADAQNKMFKLFFSSKGSRGTGLGLFITNHVIRQHGGSIQIESEMGKGSVFTVRIPRFRSGEDRNSEQYIRQLAAAVKKKNGQ